MEREYFDAPAPVPDNPGKRLAGVDFPDESALGDAISEAQVTAGQRAERLAHAVQGAVSAWLKEQGVDPEHPPRHWGSESGNSVD